MEQITNKYARVEISEEFPTIAYSYLGKGKKPYKIYCFKTNDDLRLWATKWLDQVSTKMQVVEKDKLERKKQVSEARKAEKQRLLDTVKKGTFLKRTWGCTMQRVEWYEVLSVNGTTFTLGNAKFHDDSGGWNGYSTLLGKGNGAPVAKAKIISGRIALIGDDGKLLDRGWNNLKIAQEGDRVAVYCD